MKVSISDVSKRMNYNPSISNKNAKNLNHIKLYSECGKFNENNAFYLLNNWIYLGENTNEAYNNAINVFIEICENCNISKIKDAERFMVENLIKVRDTKQMLNSLKYRMRRLKTKNKHNINKALSGEKNINDTNPPKDMEIQIFPGQSNTYELYEDDGISSLYEKDFYIVTNIDYTYQQNNFTVIIRPVAGKSGIIPPHRSYKVRFRNTREPEEVKVHVGNEKVKGYTTYVDDNDYVVELPELSTLKQITINCKGKDIEIDAVRLVNDDFESILNDLPIQTKIKNAIGDVLSSDMDIKAKRIEVRKLKKLGVNEKYIKLFLKLLEYMAEI